MEQDTTATLDEMSAEAEATPSPEAVTPTHDAPAQAAEEDVFDKDRALATIRKLREGEKAHRAQLKELEALRQERKAIEDAKLSDQERLSKRAAELEAELARERQQHRDHMNRYEVQLAASRHNIVDPDAAEKLLDWKALEYDEDGRPANLDDALTALIEAKPYLVRTDAAPAAAPDRPRQSPTNPATRTPPEGTRRYTSDQLRDRRFYVDNRADIERAMREGRIDW